MLSLNRGVVGDRCVDPSTRIVVASAVMGNATVARDWCSSEGEVAVMV